MKNLKKAAILTLAATVIVTSFALPQTAKAAASDYTYDELLHVNAKTTDEVNALRDDLMEGFTGISQIYRLYNPDNGEHLYTTDANERDVLFTEHGWGYEGVAWYAPNTGTPVYRLYNSVLCNHLYTTDTNEVATLTKDAAWTVDNNGQPLFYSSKSNEHDYVGEPTGKPIYRVYNEGLSGMHHLTTDYNEYKTLPDYGWAQEGEALRATAKGNPITTIYYENGKNQIPEIAPNNFPYELYKPMIIEDCDGYSLLGFYYVDYDSTWYQEIGYDTLESITNDYLDDYALENNMNPNTWGNGLKYVGDYSDWGKVYCRWIQVTYN